MKLVIQRVLEASVSVNGTLVSSINRGLLVFLGITEYDSKELLNFWSKKVLNIKLWPKVFDKKLEKKEIVETKEIKKEEENLEKNIENIELNKVLEKDVIEEKNNEETEKNEEEKKPWSTSVLDNNYEVLVVSQFTLYAFLKGNKPDFHKALNAKDAEIMYEYFIERMQNNYQKEKIKKGAFQQLMEVKLVNDGPVTITLEDDGQSNQEVLKAQKKKKK